MSLIERLYLRKKKLKLYSGVLENNPQVRGVVIRTKIVTPKKPNSARRPVAKITLVNKNDVVAHIPGIGHNLRKHSTVLVRGGGARDLPGVHYTCVRGVYDLAGVLNRNKRRSIYGIHMKEHMKKKLRRKFRQT
jgi:small subunit ribosomal protein S12